MKVKEVIEQLKKYNPESKFIIDGVILNNESDEFYFGTNFFEEVWISDNEE